MAGIYLHIPFCKKACHYCNFHFSTSLQLKNDFLDALLKEIALQKDYLQDEAIRTIYFGGGTPSLLEKKDLTEIFEQLNRYFTIQLGAEITLEANPDDISLEKLTTWKEVGINRLSIGVQSFFEEDLQWMNRAHHADQALQSILLSKQAGFHHLTIDLIYGTPGLTDEKWNENMSRAITLGIPHLSCYALTVEPGTALQKMISLHKTAPVDPEKQARQFLQLMERMAQEGYEHYEISNFARPGFRSRHNSSYWKGKKYLGLGPSAHSYNGISRQWNISNNALYIQSLLKGNLPFEQELLTPEQQLNEYIMISLRTLEGINLGDLAKKFGDTARLKVHQAGVKFLEKGHLQLQEESLTLSREGKLYADGIASDLFVTGL